MARQRSEMQQQQDPTTAPSSRNQFSSPEQALSPLSHAEVELLKQIREVSRITPMSTPAAAAPSNLVDEPLSASNNADVVDGKRAPDPAGLDEADAVHHRLRNKNIGSDARDGVTGGHSLRKKDQSKRKSSRHSRPLSPPKSTASSSSRWQCKACTFSNKARAEICEMCCKSKNSPVPPQQEAIHESPSSEVAETRREPNGVECQKCTLVNDWNNNVSLILHFI